MKELKIGETITIKCVEDATKVCEGCCFYEGQRPVDCIGQCSGHGRSDGKNVHFEVVDTSAEIDTKVANLVTMYLADEREMWIKRAKGWFKDNYRMYVLGGGDMIDAFCKYMEESK